MDISIQSYLNNQQASAGMNHAKTVNQMLNVNGIQSQSKSLLETYRQNNASIKTMKSETAGFLKEYATGMTKLNTAAGKLTNGGINNLLYDKEGNVTDSTIKKTVSAVKDMVGAYNSSLKTLNDNAQRGEGVVNQMARMVDDPAPADSMKMVGVSVNKDGTLALDEEKLNAVLKTANEGQRKLFTEILGDYNGIAGGIQKDARAGLDAPPAMLINSDLAKMKEIQNNDPIRSFAQSIRSGGAYALNNNAAMGILMNMMA